MTVNDGGIMHTSSFCNGLWNRPQTRVLRHRIIRRMPMEVALYTRVSTPRQQQQQTIDQQLSRLRDYVATHSEWHVANEHIYRDDGYSGATLNRPGLDRLRDRAAMAAFDCILITAPDRLARNYVHQMLLVDELTQRGCRVEFVERPMSDDPHDQLLLQIRSAVAEYERTLIAERMRRGRQAKLRSGQLLPWTRAPYGYLLDPDRPRDASRVQLDPVQAAVVAQMFAWYTDPGQTVSLYAVAKRLSDAQIPTPRGGKRWNVASIRGILRSPTYMGVAYSGRTRPAPARRRKSALQPVGPGQSQQSTTAEEWIAVPVPAIIRQETFEAAQSRLDRNVQMARRNNTTYEYLLRGLVSCGQCRLACSGRTLSPGYHYYFCRGRTDSLRLAQGERCTARYAPAHALDALVWQDLCRVLSEPSLITHELERAQMGEWLPQALQARRQTLRDVLAQLERQQARLLDLYLAEVIEREEFERRRKEVTQSQQGLRQQLRQLDAQAQQHVNVAALAQGIETFCQRMQLTLDNLTFAQRRQLVELLIDCVIVNDAQVELRYVVPTGPKGETTPFCHLRLDYLDRPTFLVDAHDLARCQRGQIGSQDCGMLGAHVAPLFAQHHRNVADMTQTQAGAIRPKRFATFPPMRSGHPGALVILVRGMGHEVFERFLLHRFPGPGDRKDKAPAAGRIGLVPVLDHPHVGLGGIGGIPAHNDQLGPPRWDKRLHHLAKQGIFAAIRRMAFGQNEPKTRRHAIVVPCRHQQHEAQAKKPGMMLTDTPFLRHRILGAAFVGVTAVAKQRQDAVGWRRQGDQEILRQPADEQMYIPIGGFEHAAKAPGGDRGGCPPGHLCQRFAPRVHGLHEDEPAEDETMAPAPHGGHATKDQ